MSINLNVTSERKEEILNQVIANLIHRQELAKTLVSNTEYILWLERFTSLNPVFKDDDWVYCSEEISEEDSIRVNELCSFFDGIAEYANRNFIPFCNNDYDSYIFIKFNNIGYRIGIISGQGSFSYCERVGISSDNFFIDFDDIVNNKRQENVDYICEKLDSMSNIIKELLNVGVSEKVISKAVENAFEKYSF